MRPELNCFSLSLLVGVQVLGTSLSLAAAPQIIPNTAFQQSAVNLGQTNIFTVATSGDSPKFYQWYFQGYDLPNETNASLIIANAGPEHEGDYSVVVTNASGSVTSSPTRLYVVPRQTDFIKGNYTNSARQRLPYFYLLPAGYDPARPYPLHYWLHGIPGDENMIDKPGGGYPGYGSYAALKVFASFRQQQADPVIVVWPARRIGDASGDWDSGYMKLLSELLDHLQTQFSIDTNRVYVEGASGGMHAVWDLLGMRKGFFAAARMSAGWAGIYNTTAILGVPTWVWCAADDSLVGDTRVAVSALRRAGVSVAYTEYKTGGHMNGIGIGTMTPMMVDWMLAQRRGQPCTTEPLLRVTSGDALRVYCTGNTTIDLAGVADAAGEAVTSVGWTNFTTNAKGVAVGSNTWSASGIPLGQAKTNVIVIAATTTSWASAYGGNTTFNVTVRVAAYPIRATLALQGTNSLLNWTGGGPPFAVQRAASLTAPQWADFLSEATPPILLPMDAPAGFYRVVGR